MAEAYIYDVATNKDITGNIYNKFIEAGLQHILVNGYTVVTFPGIFSLLDIKYEGEYYLQFSTNKGNKYYSEIFCFTNALDNYLELEYWNPESDFELSNGIVTFTNNFKFKVLLNSELGKPEYNFEEETTKRLGYNFIESQVSKKVYKFNTILPEYLCDALRLVRLCSNKIIKSKGEIFEMLSFEMAVDWQDQGDLASVNCEFEVDNVIVNFGGFKRELLGGDFHKDFNDDFNIE
jgi:hypothetical protein